MKRYLKMAGLAVMAALAGCRGPDRVPSARPPVPVPVPVAVPTPAPAGSVVPPPSDFPSVGATPAPQFAPAPNPGATYAPPLPSPGPAANFAPPPNPGFAPAPSPGLAPAPSSTPPPPAPASPQSPGPGVSAPASPPSVTFTPPGATGNSQVEYRWYPADHLPAIPPKVRLGTPEPATGDGSKNAQLKTPVVEESTKVESLFPAGIPQFQSIRTGVAAGLRPSLDGGLDWLRDKGYKTVLHIHAPGEADEADRKEVEKRGLRYLNLEVSPATLTKEKLDHFTALVRDDVGHPLFVYDKDGSLAGGLWYWQFRQVDLIGDDAARIRAGSLGLKETDGTSREMWLALQKIISDQ